ncbi:hypothetical protein FNV43_RR01611 [Rhamnella rubrinervis]|uniref:FAR1 domain-containing protein n=1 Tax=Rhamnella rubrinervis TaxID=2594499 RepID=A0A8K0HQR2_9ROSA|nr:hypothetical protein FNV43_RR01611 [Rhamnella rubrinervis]
MRVLVGMEVLESRGRDGGEKGAWGCQCPTDGLMVAIDRGLREVHEGVFVPHRQGVTKKKKRGRRRGGNAHKTGMTSDSAMKKRKKKRVDSDEGTGAVESSSIQELVTYEGDTIIEPYEGMEFDSEDAAKIFYDEYARRVGFVMRVMSCRRSERDGRILARRLGCNKEGYCVSIRGKFGPVRKPRPSTREGCKAMIHVKYDKSGKWVITKFVKDHNHPLVVSPREARQTMDEKDKKIQELTAELRNKKRLCATYQEQLTAFMKIVEEHSDLLSKKVQNVVSNLKEFECIDQELSQHR